jgi:hypothetical protein
MAITVQMWGHPAAGKTSLVTALAYSGQHGLTGIQPTLNDKTSYPEMLEVILPNIQRIANGRPLEPTRPRVSLEEVQRSLYGFLLPTGGHLEVQDVAGELTRAQAQGGKAAIDLEVDLIGAADALLFVIEPRLATLDDQFATVDRALLSWTRAGKSRARTYIAFTKCEQHLRDGHEAWRAAPGWWRAAGGQFDAIVPNRTDWLARFEGRIWPTSMFGFTDRGEPGLSLSKHGVPVAVPPIRSLNVSQLFERIVADVGETK